MSGMDEYNRLMRKKDEWQRIYDMCQECIQDANFEFGGYSSSKGEYDGTAALHLLRDVWRDRESFWKGGDSDVFGMKLDEIYQELAEMDTIFIEALNDIMDYIAKKNQEIVAEINECIDEFNLLDWVRFGGKGLLTR